MTDNIKEIISKLEELEKLKKDTNDVLLQYCLDKSESLNQRWKIWEKHVIKSESSYIKRTFRSPLLFYINTYILENDFYERYVEINYNTFLNRIDELGEREHKDIQHILRDVTINSILEDKEFDFYAYAQEEIMKENFGSYNLDW